MKKQFYHITSALAASLLAAAAMVSCQREMPHGDDALPLDGKVTFTPSLNIFSEEEGGQQDVKSFGARALKGSPSRLYLHAYEGEWSGDGIDTKSAPVTQVHSTFKVSGYAFLGSWNDQNKANLFFGETMTKSGSTWTGEAQMVWPGADYNVRFGAVSPAEASGLSWTSSATTGGMPAISYTVNNAVASQLDLLECVSSDYVGDGSTAGSGVTMTFSHALTAVKFRTNDFGTAGTVKSVSIEGVHNSGSHVVGSSVWTSQSGDADYAFAGLNQAFTASGETSVTSGANTLLLMPQTCPAGAKIIVEMTINGNDWTLESSIEGHVWAPGKEITYTISPSEDDWLFSMVDLSSVAASVKSGVATNVATVKSFRQHALGFKEALPWTIQYSTDGGSNYSGTKPSWLTAISPVSGAGGWAGEVINATATKTSGAEHRVKVKVSNSGDSKTFDIVIPVMFGGLQIASGNLYKTADGWAMADSPLDGLDTFASKYGASTTGSYYFNFLEMGALFEKAGFATSDGNIENLLDPLDGWRLPTKDEWTTLTTGTRSGASVTHGGGSASGVKYYKVLVDLTGSAYAGKGQSSYSTNGGAGASTYNATNYQAGLLLFPDDASITTTYTFPTAANTTNVAYLVSNGSGAMTYTQLTDLLSQGCALLPAAGYYSNGSWWRPGYGTIWWSSTQSGTNMAYNLSFDYSDLYPANFTNKSPCYSPVRLVK